VRLFRSALLAVGLVVAFSGCSVSIGSTPTVSTDKLESTIADKLEAQVGQRPDSVSCPDALKGKVDATVRCSLTSGSTTFGITVTTESVKGKNVRFDIQVDDAPQ
jgi:type 1 fimbria pilin